VEARGCPAEVQLLGDGDEIAQQAKLVNALKLSMDRK
jgi:hypothetical protein